MSIKLIPFLLISYFLSIPVWGEDHTFGSYKPGDNASKVGKYLNLTMQCNTDGVEVNSPSPELGVCVKEGEMTTYQFSTGYLRNTRFTEVVAVFINETLIYLLYSIDVNGEKEFAAESVVAELNRAYGAPDKSGYFEYQGNLNKKYLAAFDGSLPKEGVFIPSSLANVRTMEKVEFIQLWNNVGGVSTQLEFKASIFGRLLTVESKLVGACERYPIHCETIKTF